ncbi:MAG: sn-glycerol-3-phosphate transporter [Hahellaceae bacterium]|nr:sn-glycerol-3-phosphate transporter [Hahellaceae bacterium]MCP5211396.1 sn-glycerol-3-phosphate transporter [Hahellaceae bacterium]
MKRKFIKSLTEFKLQLKLTTGQNYLRAKPILMAIAMMTGLISQAGGAEITDTVTEFFTQKFAESNYVYAQTSLYTMHYTPKPEHNNRQNLIDLQWHWKSQYLAGLSAFQNSFDQSTQYLYLGYQWEIPHTYDSLYCLLTGGLAHGYEGKYKDQIPLNSVGVAPIVLPVIGARYKNLNSQVILFGSAGFTLTIGVDYSLN